MKQFHYQIKNTWTGNKGQGTLNYTSYERSHTIQISGKPDLLCSSDTPFRGDASKHNPEDFFLSALSACHKLWYLHVCADAGIIVTSYEDNATATLEINDEGIGKIIEVQLHPKVTITDSTNIELANELHIKANKHCFIANSVNVTVAHFPTCIASTSL